MSYPRQAEMSELPLCADGIAEHSHHRSIPPQEKPALPLPSISSVAEIAQTGAGRQPGHKEVQSGRLCCMVVVFPSLLELRIEA